LASAADLSEALRGLGRALDSAHVQMAEEGNPLARPFDAVLACIDGGIGLVADRPPAEMLARLRRLAHTKPARLVLGAGAGALVLLRGLGSRSSKAAP
jgi:hypothetical protein